MSTIQEFEAAAAKATQASAQADTWANGPINTTVPTDSGPVPTIAEFNRAAQARVDASIEAIGWVLAGDFTAGCTVTDRNQYVLVVGGAGYRWDGALPKVVTAGSSPTPIATGSWVLVGDMSLRGDLAASSGDELLGIGNGRNQSDLNAEFVMPEQFYVEGMSSWLPAINEALAASKFIQFQNGKTYACNGVPDFAGHVVKAVDVTISIPAGVYTYTTSRYLKGVIGGGMKIKAPATSTYTATAASHSGSAKAWDVTFTVASSAGVSVGDYMLVRTAAGTGYIQWVLGVWKVVAVAAGSVTLRNTCHHAAPPSLAGLTSATIRRLPVRLQFNGCNGFELHGAQLYLDGGMAIVGDWDVAAGTGTTGAHGVVVGAPNIIAGASSNTPVVGLGGITTGVDVAIYGFGEQGIADEQASAMSINFLVSCANRKRGIYVSTNVGARGKFSITNGNGEDGVICDEGGSGAFSLGVSCGNGLNGYWSTNNGFVNAANTYAIANGTNGYEGRGLCRMASDGAVSAANGAYGFIATDGAMLDADDATADTNGSDGFYGFNGAVIDANNASSKNNTGFGVNGEFSDVNFAGTGIFTGNSLGAFNTSAIGVRGYTNSGKFPFLLNQTIGSAAGSNLRAGFDATKFVDIVSTSAGDAVLKNNGANSYVIKAQGAIYPTTDNAQDYGQASNRGKIGWFAQGVQTTSDARFKSDVRQMNEAELAAGAAIAKSIGFFNWLSKDSDRLHAGTTVQTVIQCMEGAGLNAFDYGFVCYDQWADEYEEVFEAVLSETGETEMVATGEKVLVREAGDLYTFRDHELYKFLIRAHEHRLSCIESRISLLEAK